MKIGANALCPCGSGKKFKRCCDGKVDWARLFCTPGTEAARRMNVRGKNQAFLGILRSFICELDLNTPAQNKAFKDRFTVELVHTLFLSVQDLWPDQADAMRALALEKERTSGLYIGDYDLTSVVRGVTRHALYADSILLMDPFPHPCRFRPEFNPIQHPELHLANAIKGARLWLTMAPWVDAGIVRFVHAPPYFKHEEYVELLETSRARVKRHPELIASLDSAIESEMHGPDEFTKYQLLSGDDEAFIKFVKIAYPGWTKDEAFQWRETQRAAHPFYVPWMPTGQPNDVGQFLMQSIGGNYDLAKFTALQSGAHIITDLALRWKELEVDRRSRNVVADGWQPFAKAIQGARLGYLEKVTLNDALRLRKEARLESFRLFLNKIWRVSMHGDPMGEDNATSLASELDDKVREAKEEWSKIDRDLFEHFKTYAGISSAVGWGTGAFVPAALLSVVGGAVDLATAQHRRAGFELRYPAGFFIKAGS